uniref:SnoaL-like domain-containing protein n=1 Tax=Craspedostauros australis TaxID=1486917 RepID=A0A7S0F7C0_9STRA|mmetsp:Transcript_937/g.2679  ORF Transcript_937/g.2679 Transcript_937/m.2679 type:complete len:189 (+) Transcript_937:244-810(+)|eukprot:CAMPEP_0198130832 /NCGR_PEP_ID=MMETSP1442-20131203/54800_1 /TAXON_ID= /ORGANISM="Craspedostauros australis, Strain CCMP3328" /LENGTH=188 /DNA_ID=CAMNT_0043791529 /DNA_START=135 /DNA_END=701 /DNA_ORIENTATION=+
MDKSLPSVPSTSLVSLLVLLLALLQTSTIATAANAKATADDGASVTLHDKVRNGYNDMPKDWKGFRSVFAKDATLMVCIQSNDPIDDQNHCKEGSFDDILGPFQHNVKLSMFEMTNLMGPVCRHDCLVHWSHYISTPDGCEAVWTGYSTLEVDVATGKIKRSVSFTNDADALSNCIPALGPNPASASK